MLGGFGSRSFTLSWNEFLVVASCGGAAAVVAKG